MLADPAIPASAKNTQLIPAAPKKITKAEKALAAARAARGKAPAKLPANVIDANAQVALLRASRRGLQMVLRLLAHNAEHWMSSHLNAYLQDDARCLRTSGRPRPEGGARTAPTAARRPAGPSRRRQTKAS
jgi:hypothetical protein